MIHYKSNIIYKNSRLYILCNLLFFVLMMAIGCKSEQHEIAIVWENNKAKGIRIPAKMVNSVSKDKLAASLKIRRFEDTTAILGDYRFENDVVFEPLVPFTRGMDYEIFFKGTRIGNFTIPPADSSDAPHVIAAYPQQDTVPENLLKIYIQFSHPMREGESLKHISFIKNGTDTLHDVFLDLQPELWNEDRTTVTIWLDPGRIKRDLQPNLRLGAPMKQKEKYQLYISKEWKDVDGRALQKEFSRPFVTTLRDSLSPVIARWKLVLPKANSREPLVIEFKEALDHFLAMETLHIKDQSGNEIKGVIEVINNDKACRFIPAQPWAAGKYVLLADAKLEDLAGNNLNRPFERDITKTKQPSTQEQHSKSFIIEK